MSESLGQLASPPGPRRRSAPGPASEPPRRGRRRGGPRPRNHGRPTPGRRPAGRDGPARPSPLSPVPSLVPAAGRALRTEGTPPGAAGRLGWPLGAHLGRPLRIPAAPRREATPPSPDADPKTGWNGARGPGPRRVCAGAEWADLGSGRPPAAFGMQPQRSRIRRAAFTGASRWEFPARPTGSAGRRQASRYGTGRGAGGGAGSLKFDVVITGAEGEALPALWPFRGGQNRHGVWAVLRAMAVRQCAATRSCARHASVDGLTGSSPPQCGACIAAQCGAMRRNAALDPATRMKSAPLPRRESALKTGGPPLRFTARVLGHAGRRGGCSMRGGLQGGKPAVAFSGKSRAWRGTLR